MVLNGNRVETEPILMTVSFWNDIRELEKES